MVPVLVTLFGLMLGVATAQASECGNARFTKSVAITNVLIAEPPNDISHLGHALAHRLGRLLVRQGGIHPTYLTATRSSAIRPAVDAFERMGAPYFIHLRASNMSVNGTTSRFALLGPSIDPRGATLDVTIDNGSTASPIARFEVAARADSTEQFDPTMDANSSAFWHTRYGHSLDVMLQQAAKRITAELDCLPMVGTIRSVNGDRLHADIGSLSGIRNGDRVLVIRRGKLLLKLGDADPMQRQDYTLGVGRVVGLGPGTSVIQFESDKTVKVGDLIWTGEAPR